MCRTKIRDGIFLPRRLMPMANLTYRSRVNARSLRQAESQAERLLWLDLRDRRLNGYKFVRQLPIGPYFADFACRDRKLVVEVDGATHGDAHAVAHDARRTAFLEAKGWRVLRVMNIDVFTARADVCEAIMLALESGDRG
jgi:very-short-patch-repair endonuclease